MDEKNCELCGNKSKIDFNYALQEGYSFEKEISDNPSIFQAFVCFDCMAGVESDAHLVVAIANKRKEGG